MTNIRTEILNLPCNPNRFVYATNEELAYKHGHRDARHAAAELAAARVGELEGDNETLEAMADKADAAGLKLAAHFGEKWVKCAVYGEGADALAELVDRAIAALSPPAAGAERGE